MLSPCRIAPNKTCNLMVHGLRRHKNIENISATQKESDRCKTGSAYKFDHMTTNYESSATQDNMGIKANKTPEQIQLEERWEV